ncbi:hypothetical protein PoB_003315300 [Plakobranchus ocellatus]|uniref:Uncharacterized protein n=1 Tax=Plakobranchus ocellatus TaxID=259542 RepID=A0AAV4AIN2_9GAST|nr:hypothetical protein PoB_003315300 [Plakobranchus ocellatus]
MSDCHGLWWQCGEIDHGGNASNNAVAENVHSEVDAKLGKIFQHEMALGVETQSVLNKALFFCLKPLLIFCPSLLDENYSRNVASEED